MELQQIQRPTELKMVLIPCDYNSQLIEGDPPNLY